MIITSDHINELLLQGEGLHLEMKRCKKDSLPSSLWETYSAFANSQGGVILLGVEEDKAKKSADRFTVVGVGDAEKLVADLFNTLNNTQKVNRCILLDSDVQVVEVNGRSVIYIHVPEAYYRQKPVFINNNLQSGTYKRLHEGDRHVTADELAMLIRDSSDTVDSQIMTGYGMGDVDGETLRKYRQAFQNMNPGHPYTELSDRDFLMQMGGYATDAHKASEGLTMAGMLMFGKSLPIHKNFPNFRFDYLDLVGIEPGDSRKWNDRLTDDGRWVDNIYNFLNLALNKLLFTLPSEGKLKGVQRIDGGELHEGVREGFVNCLTYCDYLLGGVLRIDRRDDRIVMRNPGNLRIPPERIYQGDYTLARNTTIQKMLRMIGFGDNIGSGFSKILKAWSALKYPVPVICEHPEVNEVWLTLPLIQSNVGDNVVEDVGDNVGDMPVTQLTEKQREIINMIQQSPTITAKQMSVTLSVTKRTVERYLSSLKSLGWLTRRGTDNDGEWVILNKPEK